ncbi:MAG TPA: DUF2059 domain-containing protein [Candidatus Omnitrophota bacterium]|nr:DUF2059 domain-containing protein [Candidatus Omnitrophota bacterium]HPN57179.1 DUF2059 domain-containing protein [Candidatus Omnitrophota bacterium]
MKNRFWAGLLVLLLCPGSLWADEILLKNGNKIDGKILEESKYSIKVLVDKKIQTFYLSEIEKITRDEEIAKEKKEKKEGDAKKKELILNLLKANLARDNMQKIFNQIIEQAPEETQSRLRKILLPDEIIERLVPLYSKYYSSEELQDLINFYTSPTGKKHLEKTPELLEETLVEAVKYFQDKVAEQ